MSHSKQPTPRLLALLFALFLGMGTAWAYNFSATAPSGQRLYYNIISSSAHTVGVVTTGNSNYITGDVEVPSTVMYNGVEYTVTALLNPSNNGSFQGTSITSLILPSTINNVQGAAFYMCSNLHSIIIYAVIPPSLTGNTTYATFLGLPSDCVLIVPPGTASVYSAAWNGFNGSIIDEMECYISTFVGPEGSGTTIGGGIYQYGQSCTLTAEANEGYVFVNWTENGAVVSMDASYTFEVFRDRNLVANFAMEGNIVFADANVKALCVANWDSNNDGELSYFEAASVTNLGTVFKNKTNITSFNELQYFTCLTSIDSEAFYGCTALTQITIPEPVTSVGSKAFWNCPALQTVNYNAINCTSMQTSYNSNTYSVFSSDGNGGAPALKRVIIGSSVQRIPDYAFKDGVDIYPGVTIRSSVTAIGAHAFENCSSITTLSFQSNSTLANIGASAFRGCSALNRALNLPNSLVTLGQYAFYGCTAIPSLTLGTSLETIGGYAFWNCPNLATVNFNATNCTSMVTNSQYSVFNSGTNNGGATPIVTLSIGNNVTYIPDYAFRNSPSITHAVTIPDATTYIGQYAFLSIQSAELTIGTGVATIGGYAFWNCPNLATVNFNATNCTSMVTNSQYSVFNIGTINGGATPIVALSIGENVTNIPAYAFRYGSNMANNLVIPNCVTTIGQYAFDGCSGFNGNLTLPNSVANIGQYAFNGCSGFNGTLTLPVNESFTIINQYTFNGCSGLTGTLTISANVTEVANSAFRGCSSFTGPLVLHDAMTTIGQYAFYGCSGIPELTIGQGISTIGAYAYWNCPGLATVHFNATNCTSMVTNSQYSVFNSGTNNGGTTPIVTLTIGESVTNIPAYAFRYGSNMANDLVIPNSVTTIGQYAFGGCSGQSRTLTLGNSVASIGQYAFSGCSGFTGDLVIPNSVNTIGQYAFSGCSGFDGSLTVGRGVQIINQNTFANCSGFSGVLILGTQVNNIGNNAFQNCSSFALVITENPNPIAAQSSTFTGMNYSIPVYVPDGLVGNYQNATGWNNFTNYIEQFTFWENIDSANWSDEMNWLSMSLPTENDVVCITYNCDLDIDFDVLYVYIYNINDVLTIKANKTLYTTYGVGLMSPSQLVIEQGGHVIYGNGQTTTFTITVGINPDEGGMVTGAGVYSQGDICTLTATPNPGYTFQNWTENGTVVSTDASYSFLVTGSRTLVAIFVADGPIDYSQEYFTIESLEDNNTITLTIGSAVTQDHLQSVSYSTDNGATWTTTDIDNTTQTISVTANAGDKVCWKGLGTSFASGTTDETNWSTFTATGQHEVYGNIMSLLYGDDFASQTVFPDGSTFTFNKLFSENTTLASAANLVLPATTLAQRCYGVMFYGCTSLAEAPALPATTLASSCYSGMFYGCTSLTQAPALPATTLASSCYSSMFYGCTSLTQAPALPATTLAEFCYNNMFRECTSLVQAPVLPATALAQSCYSFMFDGCTSLAEAPALPATTLAQRCYSIMFRSCTSLTQAPVLPATTLALYCYYSMFDGCTSLAEAPALPATTLAEWCYATMFYGCTSLAEAPALPATTLANYCYNYMFYGCTSLNEVTCLATDISAQGCTTGWLNGVAATGTFHKNIAMEEWPTNSASGIPTGWNVEEVSIVCPITATANPVEGGTVSGAGDYYYGSTCTLTAEPNDDWAFVSWSKDGAVITYDNPSYSFVVMEGGDYTASFFPLEGNHVIGEGSGTNMFLPSYSFYKYTLSQQIYTAEEIGRSGNINSIAFLNAGVEKTRTYDIYLVHTAKTSFESNTDWIAVTEADRVYSGPVTMAQGSWTTIAFDTPFAYDGVSNLAVVIDDNSGNWTGAPHMACRVFNANGNQAIRVYSDGTNYDPYNPSSYGGTLHNVKNQVIFGFERYMITVSADPEDYGTVTGGGYYHTGSTCTLTANANAGYTFVNWTENGTVVSTDAAYSFTVNEPRTLVANFSLNSFEVLAEAHPEEGGTVTGGGTYNYGETATLTATANEGYTFDHWSDGYASEYFTIESLEDGNTITLTIPAVITTSYMTSVSYSTDNGATWNTTDIDGTAKTITISLANSGDKVLFKGLGRTLTYGNSHDTEQSYFSGSKQYIVYGNIASLLYGDDFEDKTQFPNNSARTYQGLFRFSTTLVSAQHLVMPFSVVAGHCFRDMFQGCTALTQAPALPATTLNSDCYMNMFNSCTALTHAPELPATTLASECYNQMFRECSSLTHAPELPAQTIAYMCYYRMFEGCTALTHVPILPATTLASTCYYRMFAGCTSLIKAPELLATVLTYRCYKEMFYGCTSLNEITCLATDLSETECTLNWLFNVASTGTFHKAADMTGWTTGASGIPTGWTVEDITTDYQTPFEEQYFTIESLEDGNTITLTIGSAVTQAQMQNISYSTDNGATWSTTTIDDTEQVISVSLNAGEEVLWKGLGTNMASGYQETSQWSVFSSTKQHVVYGNIASLLFGDDFVGQYGLSVTPNNGRSYQRLFSGDVNLLSAEHLILPFTTLQRECYGNLFQGCSSLVSAPELPATALMEVCYSDMFHNCSSLAQAPELPANTLLPYCYRRMFQGCSSLVEITSFATNISATDCTLNWVQNIASTGIFHKASGMNDWPTGVSGIPSGWTVFEEAPVDPTEPSFSYTVTGDRYWLANFTLNSYEINASVSPVEGGTVTGTGTYNHFDNCTLMANANAGYTFVNWTENDNPVSTDVAYSFTVTGSRTLVAIFVADGPIDYSQEYFTIESLMDNNTITLTIGSAVTQDQLQSVSYSTDNGATWTTTTIDNTTQTISVTANAGDKVCWKGLGTSFASGNTDETNWSTFTATGQHEIYGNIMSLLYGNDYASQTVFPEGSTFTFYKLFSENTTLASAANLVLPAMTLTHRCYSNIFRGCTSLVEAPELPATTLADYCYQSMFYGCTPLGEAPALPATTLAQYCYVHMFNGCTSLTQAPALPATTLADYCYQSMFYGCTSLVEAPELPATTLADYCYNYMFNGCTSLTEAPVLPATTMAYQCYSYMFNGCTSLTQAPALPATTLANYCYSHMFHGCTSLAEAPALPATTLAQYCYYCMFWACYSLAEAPALPATTLNLGCYQGMFWCCTSLTEAPALPATTLASYCYVQMFYGCTSLAEAPALPATTMVYGCYQSMFQSCTSLTEAPALPATTLANYCYDGMFSGCTSLTQAPALPATILADYCYDGMFYGCTSLAETPVLPATTLANYCYGYLFYGCTSLTEAPALPATTLANSCYIDMFSGCTSLVEAPALPATTLANSCYGYMFWGCTSLTQAPALPATTLANSCYLDMFYGCTSLNEVTCLATDISAQDCTTNWLSGVATTGTFHKNIAMEDWPTNSASGIPTGWNVEEVSIVCPITVAANPLEGGAVNGAGDYYYGSTCTLTAEPNEDWAFVSWSKDGTVVSYDNPYSFVVMEGGDYTASFIPLEGNHVIGEGSGANEYLPSYSYYKYTLSQQIYTAEEIGESGNINSIAFLNAGGEKTRTYDIYLVHTAKTSFESNTDWIAVTEADRVYSGLVTMAQGSWTTIAFDTPFAYDGVSNLAVVVDDNSGNWTEAPHMACRIFNANGNQAIRVYSDDTNYNPFNPSSYGGTLHNVKNQVVFGFERYMITVSADPEGYGTVTGGGYYHSGSTCTLTATPATGYTFINWTKDGVQVSTDAIYSFTVTENSDFIAHFSIIATQSSNLAQGWNWWAPTVAATLQELETALGVNGFAIMAEDGSTLNYANGQWNGTLESLVLGQMYRINTSSPCEFTLTGAKPASVEVSLAHGAHWFGFTGSAPTAIGTVFGTAFGPVAGDKVVSQNGGFAIYNGTAWQGTLTTLLPGQGYVYVSQSNETKTLVME